MYIIDSLIYILNKARKLQASREYIELQRISKFEAIVSPQKNNELKKLRARSETDSIKKEALELATIYNAPPNDDEARIEDNGLMQKWCL